MQPVYKEGDRIQVKDSKKRKGTVWVVDPPGFGPGVIGYYDDPTVGGVYTHRGVSRRNCFYYSYDDICNAYPECDLEMDA